MHKRALRFLSFLTMTILFLLTVLPSFALVPEYDASTSFMSGVYYSRLLQVQLTGDMRKDIIAVAQSQVGYQEGASSTDLSGLVQGGNNGTEYNHYVAWYLRTACGYENTYYYAGGWCGMFVSYCAAMAGVPRTVLKFSTTAKVNSFGFGGSNPLPGSQLKGFYDLAVKGGSYFPQPGDVIFYASYNTEGTPSASEGKHVGFVESCEAEYATDGSVSRMVINTIEGNSSDSVKRHSWKMTADSSGWVYSGTYIYAFGIPNYTESGLQSYSNYDIGAYGGTLLRKGNSSEAVRRLQVALNLAEYFDPQGNACTVTGTFDEGTYEAVCSYQRAHSLEVDGIVGNDTWTALRRQLVGCTSRLESDFLVENGRILLYMGKDFKAALPEDCTSIAPYAFYGTDTMDILEVPRTLKAVEENAFNGCEGLSEVIFVGTETEKEGLHIEAPGNAVFTSSEWSCQPKIHKITFDLNGTKVVIDCQVDCLPEFKGSADTQDDLYKYYFTGWDRPLVPATEDTEYKAEYFAVPIAPLVLSAGSTAGAPGETVQAVLSVSDAFCLSSFSFCIDYSSYIGRLRYTGFMSEYAGLEVDSSTDGILKISKEQDGTVLSGEGDLLSLQFEVAEDAWEEEMLLYVYTSDGDSFSCTDGEKEYPLELYCEGILAVNVRSADRYDYTGDGTVNIADVTFLLDYISGGAPSEEVGNSSGPQAQGSGFSISDVAELLDWIARNGA